jgi:hypothetical protein
VANAPGLFGYVEAVSRLDMEPKDIEILSIGTLSSNPTLNAKIDKQSHSQKQFKQYNKYLRPIVKLYTGIRNYFNYGVGLMYWMNPFSYRLLELALSQNEQQANNILKLLLKENYHHIDGDVSASNQSNVALDDPRELAKTILINNAIEQFKLFSATSFYKKINNKG